MSRTSQHDMGGGKARTGAWGFPRQDPGDQNHDRRSSGLVDEGPPPGRDPHRFPLGLADPGLAGLLQPQVAVSKTGSGFRAAAIIPGPLDPAWSKRL